MIVIKYSRRNSYEYHLKIDTLLKSVDYENDYPDYNQKIEVIKILNLDNLRYDKDYYPCTT